ncbi:MAG: hypothetical protein JSR61_02665 [Proteobacteria bacterium]|nr:hypothetical protein [Pseudomonadota bacterium]
MPTIRDAAERVVLSLAIFALQAKLQNMPAPVPVQVDFEHCEGETSAMLYVHLSDDDVTGGLPIAATFDVAKGETEADWRAGYEAAVAPIASEVSQALIEALRS